MAEASRDPSRAKLPGGPLLVAHDMWLRGGDDVAKAADEAGLTVDAMAQIRDFHKRIVERASGEPLILCRGVSCRLNRADDFHAVLKADLQAAGALGTTVEVHCLSQCDHGPNVKLGDAVLCTGKGVVVNDVRPWRPVTAGPKPVAPTP